MVGHPIRRAVLDALGERDIGLSATDLAQLLGESVKAVWYHLNELDKLGAIVEVGRLSRAEPSSASTGL